MLFFVRLSECARATWRPFPLEPKLLQMTVATTQRQRAGRERRFDKTSPLLFANSIPRKGEGKGRGVGNAHITFTVIQDGRGIAGRHAAQYCFINPSIYVVAGVAALRQQPCGSPATARPRSIGQSGVQQVLAVNNADRPLKAPQGPPLPARRNPPSTCYRLGDAYSPLAAYSRLRPRLRGLLQAFNGLPRDCLEVA